MILFKLGQLILRTYFKILYNIRAEGLDEVPRDTNFIYIANHRTNNDPPFIGCHIPGKLAFMAKEELFRNKLFATLIKILGAFPVSRGKGDSQVIDISIDRLNNGKNLIIFPEGTRSKNGKIGRGHTGAALIAAKSGKQIIPVGIVYGEDLGFRTKVTLKFGKPIDPAEYCEICDEPNPRQLVKLKNRYMEDLKSLVYGEEGEEGFLKLLEEREAKAAQTEEEEKTDE